MSGVFCNLFRKLNIIAINNSNLVNPVCSKLMLVLNTKSRFYSNEPNSAHTPFEVVDPAEDSKVSKEVIKAVSNQASLGQQGRLFAVVQVAGKQFKITHGDVIVIEGYWPPDVGDKITLDKILLVGAKDFTLVGKPVVERGLVNIHATVIEKCLSHTKTHFRKKRRKQYKRINFFRIQQTHLRINDINMVGELNNPPEISGIEHTVF